MTSKLQRPPRKTFLGFYLGDLRDLGEYARQLWRGDGFGRTFFDAKYAAVDPWGYENSPYDELKRALVRYGLGGRRFEHLLDLGSGEGVVAKFVEDRAARISLADLSAVAVARARQRLQVPGDDHVGDALSLLRELPESYCDAIVISEMLYYLAPLPMTRYGRELRDQVVRVLAPGGRLVLLHPYGWLHALYRRTSSLRVAARAELATRRKVSMLALDKLPANGESAPGTGEVSPS